MKKYYTDYVTHCLRFYCNYPDIEIFCREADRLNWEACELAFMSFRKSEQELLTRIFKSKEPISDLVNQILKERPTYTEEDIRKLVIRLERKVARNRGLI